MQVFHREDATGLCPGVVVGVAMVLATGLAIGLATDDGAGVVVVDDGLGDGVFFKTHPVMAEHSSLALHLRPQGPQLSLV